MPVEYIHINLFYPLLFIVIITITVTIGLVIAKKSSDKTQTDVFYKSNDNAKDVTIHVTDRLSQAHTEVIALPERYEKELDSLEKSVKGCENKLIEITEDINNKLNLLLDRVTKLEEK